jgi:hypothetical protein
VPVVLVLCCCAVSTLKSLCVTAVNQTTKLGLGDREGGEVIVYVYTKNLNLLCKGVCELNCHEAMCNLQGAKRLAQLLRP